MSKVVREISCLVVIGNNSAKSVKIRTRSGTSQLVIDFTNNLKVLKYSNEVKFVHGLHGKMPSWR